MKFGRRSTTHRGAVIGKVVTGLAVVGVLGLVGWGLNGQLSGASGEGLGDLALFEAATGPMTISVSESGTIEAKNVVVIKSEVEGRTTVIYLAPEGRLVKEGDLIVELDSSSLIDQRVDQQIRVENAEAAVVRETENRAVTLSQGESDISRAALDYRFAQEDRTQYLEGEYPNQKRVAESKITLAAEELQRAEERIEWSERLFEEKYISQSELDGDRLALKRSQLDHESAVAELALLEDFTYTRRLAELDSEIVQTKLALERITRRAAADRAQADAQLRAAITERDRQTERLAKFSDQIEKCKIFAPSDGMVIYASSGGGWREEPLEEGQEVRERQELIKLPTASEVMARITIHESSLKKVEVGQRVRITVDALPNRRFEGVVSFIAPLPDQQSVWLNPDLKVYRTDIDLMGDVQGVRSGMSCRAEIIVDEYEETLYIPVQAVVRVGGRPTVYVKSGGKLEPRAVEVGLDNNRMISIEGGLRSGEMVALTPPLNNQAMQQVDRPAPDESEAGGGSAPPASVPVRAGDRGPQVGAGSNGA